MDRPVVNGTGRWIRVPKLRQEELASRRIEATRILHDGGIMTAQLRIRTVRRASSINSPV